METINIRLNEDALLIEKNIYNLSLSLGRKVNVSDLLRHILKGVQTRKDLYDLGYISLVELNSIPTITKGSLKIKLNNRKMRK